MEKIKNVAVIGAGLMGAGIAQVAAQAGFEVTVRDINDEVLQKARATIEKKLAAAVTKKRFDEAEAQNILGRLKFTTDSSLALKDAQYVIEAVPEILDLKRRVFTEIDDLASDDAVLATNTSELSISSIAGVTKRPDRVIGTHWFFPAQVMKLIEVVTADETSSETLATTLEFCAALGKETVVCKDAQGFITSRAISALIAECLRIYEDGIASIEDIDKAMRLGFNHPIGPFQLVDMSGVDVVFHALKGLTEEYGERFQPARKMAELVDRKNLGQKTGKGFYTYEP